jgi:hypothetical protein
MAATEMNRTAIANASMRSRKSRCLRITFLLLLVVGPVSGQGRRGKYVKEVRSGNRPVTLSSRVVLDALRVPLDLHGQEWTLSCMTVQCGGKFYTMIFIPWISSRR